MSDNSAYISGIAPEVFETMRDKLPPWATQATAEKMQTYLKQMLGIQTNGFATLAKGMKNGGMLKKKDVKDLNDELTKLTKGMKEEEKNSKKREKDLEPAHHKYLFGIEGLTTGSKGLNIAFAAMAIAGEKVIEVFKQNIESYDKLVAGGANVVSGFDGVGDGFQAISQLSALTGVKLSELAPAITKYQTAINSVGMKKFGQTINDTRAQMSAYGFSNAESAEAFGAMTSAQQRYMDVSGKTNEENNRDLLNFGKNISRLSAQTGIARSTIISNYEAIANSTDANIYAGKVGKDTAESMEEFLASFKDQNVAKEILNLINSQMNALNPMFKSFTAVGMGGFASKMANFTNSIQGMSALGKGQAFKRFIDENRGELDRMKPMLQLLAQTGNAEAQASLDRIASYEAQANATKKMSQEEIDKQEATNAASQNLQKAFQKFTSSLFGLIAPTTGMLESMTKFLDILNGGISWLQQKFIDHPWLQEVVSEGAAAAGALALLVAGLVGAIKVLKWFGLMGAGKGVAGVAGKATSSIGEGIGTGLSGLGKGLTGLGKGLGSGIGAVLTGLANGLKELGSPKVLLGVVSLTGVAGATWVAAKAFEEFANVSWQNVVLGIGTMAALSLGAAALSFIAPEMILGAAALGILSIAIMGVGKGMQMTASSFEMFGTGIQTIKDGLKDFTGLSTLKDIVSTINSIDLLKVAGFALLAKLNLVSPTASTINSPSSSATASTPALSSASEAPVGPGKDKAANKSDINSLIAYQGSVLEQILNSTNKLVSVNQDILKHTRNQ